MTDRPATLATVRAVVAECLCVEATAIDDDADLFTVHGADSLDRYEIALDVERRLDIDLPDDEIDAARSIADYVRAADAAR